MSYSSDLLSQAKHLAENEPKRPKQASLRRAVSAAYYALYHLLVSEAAVAMLKGPNALRIRPVFRRGFVHAHMKRAAISFAGGTVKDIWKSPMGGQPVSADLQQLAAAFVDLQEARHDADYDLSRNFSRRQVRDLIEVAERATASWRSVRSTLEGQVFLAALLLDDRVSRIRSK